MYTLLEWLLPIALSGWVRAEGADIELSGGSGLPLGRRSISSLKIKMATGNMIWVKLQTEDG